MINQVAVENFLSRLEKEVMCSWNISHAYNEAILHGWSKETLQVILKGIYEFHKNNPYVPVRLKQR